MKLFSVRFFSIFLLVLSLVSCANYKPINVREWSVGMHTEWLQVKGFNLLTLKKAAENNSQKAIHFYIEGDGTPWVTRYVIAENPTPRYPLALELMKRDPNLSFYLGRPCFYQEPNFYRSLNDADSTSPCDFHYWTDARYSEEVVDLMKTMVEESLNKLPNEQKKLPVILIGHSGGGTLAMLIAQRLERVNGVITVAANMDTKAWTTRQGYSPLKNSLNVTTETHLRKMPQVHFAGSADDVVPPDINYPLMKKMEQKYNLIEGFNHDCCWLRDWPVLLLNAENALNQQTRN